MGILNLFYYASIYYAYCIRNEWFIKLYENPFKEYELLHFGRRGVMYSYSILYV